MKSLKKLELEDFKHFNLTTSSLKSIVGGTNTSINMGKGISINGPDFIDNCCRTTYSNGTQTAEKGDCVY